jgi:hypothetical protein
MPLAQQNVLPAACMDNTSFTDAAPGSTSSSVIIFTTTGCPYCKKAKEALTEQHILYQVGVHTCGGALALCSLTGLNKHPVEFEYHL